MTPWWQSGVIYQIYPRSFADSDGDGVGDLRGVTMHLDYLTEVLGVDAIWLSPFFPSPMADFGYDVTDFRGVDARFGTLDHFDELLGEAHARGLRVIIDFVANHTSHRHPWFAESRASRTNPKRDWYVWSDPGPDGGPPNNWLSVFGGRAWTLDPATGQYYLHTFLKEQPDLNWRHPEVEEAMMNVLRFWLDRGVDGFRIDAAHHIMKDPFLRDNPPRGVVEPHPDAPPVERSTASPLSEYETQDHIHDAAHPDIHPIFRKMRRLVDSYPAPGDRVAIGEIQMSDLERWTSFYGTALDELHMPFNFSLLKAPWTAAGIRRSVDALERAIPDGAWPNYMLGSHDVARLADRYGEAGGRLAAMLLLTLRGTPTLYYGDELAMPQTPIPDSEQQDPWGRRVPGMGRDGCRTPMAWRADPQGGFTKAAAPWLPLHTDFERRNVASQLRDPGSPLNLVRQLLVLRRTTPALRTGCYQALDAAPEDCFVFVRTLEGVVRLVALNLGKEDRVVALPSAGRTILSTRLDVNAAPTSDRLHLRSEEGVIAALQE